MSNNSRFERHKIALDKFGKVFKKCKEKTSLKIQNKV